MLYSFKASCLNASLMIQRGQYDLAEHYLRQAIGRANLVSKASLPRLMSALNLIRSHNQNLSRIAATH